MQNLLTMQPHTKFPVPKTILQFTTKYIANSLNPEVDFARNFFYDLQILCTGMVVYVLVRYALPISRVQWDVYFWTLGLFYFNKGK